MHRDGSQAFSRAKKVFEHHGVECADLEFQRETEGKDKQGQGKRTRK